MFFICVLIIVVNLIFQLFHSGNLQSYKPEKFFPNSL